MAFKVGLLFLTLYIGSYALPTVEQDPSLLLNHTDASSRIVGGSVAGKVPHMVALTTIHIHNGTKVREFFCGGSLVTNRHVLTAAHCIEYYMTKDGILDENLRGTVGSNRWDSGGIQIVFARGIIHEDYKSKIAVNDIAILVSTATIPLSDTVKLINLNYNWVDADVPTTVHGWGYTFENGSASEVLLQLNAKVLDGDNCVKELPHRPGQKWSPIDSKLEICAFHSAGRGICKGDSGSPLLRSDTNEQIGITSWVIPCARNAPDVFVRISVYENWLKKNLI